MSLNAKRLLSQIYVQVLIGIVIGAVVGYVFPQVGTALKPLADGFIKLIKMLLAPIIFGTVVVGMARMGDLKEVGRIGVKALLYFEVLSTIALVIGLVVVNVMQPGAGMNIDAGALDGKALAPFTEAAKDQGVVSFLLDIIPATFVDAFAKGAMLQVILLSVLTGVAASQMGERRWARGRGSPSPSASTGSTPCGRWAVCCWRSTSPRRPSWLSCWALSCVRPACRSGNSWDSSARRSSWSWAPARPRRCCPS
jgi:L-cystine uptake protein TcyP (sodium:dicarboxylate symporter family)